MAMNSPPAGEATISRDDAGRLVVTLSGEIDIATADDIGRDVLAAVDAATPVVVDLSGVAFMDTSGIALLLDIANSAAGVELRSPSTQVRRVVEASGLATILRMTP
jgi:anti-sigma B factor antagonist